MQRRCSIHRRTGFTLRAMFVDFTNASTSHGAADAGDFQRSLTAIHRIFDDWGRSTLKCEEHRDSAEPPSEAVCPNPPSVLLVPKTPKWRGPFCHQTPPLSYGSFVPASASSSRTFENFG